MSADKRQQEIAARLKRVCCFLIHLKIPVFYSVVDELVVDELVELVSL